VFILKIRLGNAAMQTQDDVAMALSALALKMSGDGDDDGVIMDFNGNKVGEWKFRAEKRLAREREEG
jgi:hypothetical protein